MNIPMLSVIIPVYNIENYISECLDSLISQTFTNIEIICVDDDSTDNSLNILTEYSIKDQRIIILKQEYNGQSFARNQALNIANGKYVYFLDGDDYIDVNTFEKCISMLEQKDLDIIFFCGNTIFESLELEDKFQKYKNMYQKKTEENTPLTGIDMFNKFIKHDDYLSSQCLYISKKSFINDNQISFKKHIIHEDNLFTFKILLTSKRVLSISDVFL